MEKKKADYKPELREGVVGPGMALNAGFKGEAEIVATIICGDSYLEKYRRSKSRSFSYG